MLWATLAGERAEVQSVLDGIGVNHITSSLEAGSRVAGLPHRLSSNAGIAFKGYDFGDPGFLVERGQAEQLIASNPRNAEVVLPFLNGRDLNSSPELEGDRFAIFFADASEQVASSFIEPFEHLRTNLSSRRIETVQNWWQFHRSRPALRHAIGVRPAVIAVSTVSSHAIPVLIPTGHVMASALTVFVGDVADMAILTSAPHALWVVRWCSLLRQHIRYTPSDVYETFPMPGLPTERVFIAGGVLDDVRREIMRRRQLGLTALYNLINDGDIQGDEDVDRLREIQVEVDKAAIEAYGWDDISLEHGFYAYRQLARWTVSPAARIEILDRLLLLNHERAREGGQEVPKQMEML